MKKYYLKLFCFLLHASLLAQSTAQDTIIMGLTIPEIIFAEDKEESERLLSHNRIEKIEQVHVNVIRKNFLYPPRSASAPNIGESIETTIAVTAIAVVHNKVPRCSSLTIYFVKNAPYTNVTIMVVKG